jgi:hypothetical protein
MHAEHFMQQAMVRRCRPVLDDFRAALATMFADFHAARARLPEDERSLPPDELVAFCRRRDRIYADWIDQTIAVSFPPAARSTHDLANVLSRKIGAASMRSSMEAKVREEIGEFTTARVEAERSKADEADDAFASWITEALELHDGP